MRGLGQKYMGARPETQSQAVFQDTSIHTDKDHPVPISNFMNAQCMCIYLRAGSLLSLVAN